VIRGVRARLTATIVFLVVLTAVVLGVAAYLFVDVRLHEQTRQDAGDQARFDLSVLAPQILGPTPTPESIQELVAAFRFRSLKSIIVPAGGQPIHDPSTLQGTLETIPPSVRRFVADGQIAYSWQTVAGVPSLIVGGKAGGDGAEIYLVHDVSAVQDALDQLRLALIVGGVALTVVAVVAARRARGPRPGRRGEQGRPADRAR
jgi:hypothetical protein